MSNPSSKKLKANAVTDDQGRQRFHGAFTGGFSAGYFNTVGSEDGFKPKSFVSSRSNRANKQSELAQDFMDSEDGISGSLTSKKEFDTFDNKTRQQIDSAAEAAGRGGIIPGSIPSELIVFNSKSIGKRLLALMGWKEGQGIGARIFRPSFAQHGQISGKFIPQSAFEEGVLTFAPLSNEDKIEIPPPKSDLYGVGFNYDSQYADIASYRNTRGETLSSRNIYRVDNVLKNRNNTLSLTVKSASGFSAFDDDDEDVYENSFDRATLKEASSSSSSSGLLALTEFSMEEDDGDVDMKYKGGKEVRDDAVDAWLGPKPKPRERCPSDGRLVLEGFTFGEMKTEIPGKFPLLDVPVDFNSLHIFENALPSAGSATREKRGLLSKTTELGSLRDPAFTSSASSVSAPTEDLRSNGTLGGQSTKSASVFDLLSQSAKDKIQRAIASGKEPINPPLPPPPSLPPQQQQQPLPQPPSQAAQQPTERPMLISGTVLNSAFAGLSASFKSRFVSASDATLASDPTRAGAGAGTEGLKTSAEHAEALGVRAAAVRSSTSSNTPSRGAGSMHSTTGTLSGGGGLGRSLLSTTALSAGTGAATDGTAGTGSRSAVKHVPSRLSLPWSPAPLLCKRFNVPVPDPTQIHMSASQSSSAAAALAALAAPLSAVASSAARRGREQDDGTGTSAASSDRLQRGGGGGGRESEIFDKYVGRFMQAGHHGSSMDTGRQAPESAAPTAGSVDTGKRGREEGSGSRNGAGSSVARFEVVEEEYNPRPPMALFKSIFENSDSSSDSDGDSDSNGGSGSGSDDDDDDDGKGPTDIKVEAAEKSSASHPSIPVSSGEEGKLKSESRVSARSRQPGAGVCRDDVIIAESRGGVRNLNGSREDTNTAELDSSSSSSSSASVSATDETGKPRIVFRKPGSGGNSNSSGSSSGSGSSSSSRGGNGAGINEREGRDIVSGSAVGGFGRGAVGSRRPLVGRSAADISRSSSSSSSGIQRVKKAGRGDSAAAFGSKAVGGRMSRHLYDDDDDEEGKEEEVGKLGSRVKSGVGLSREDDFALVAEMESFVDRGVDFDEHSNRRSRAESGKEGGAAEAEGMIVSNASGSRSGITAGNGGGGSGGGGGGGGGGDYGSSGNNANRNGGHSSSAVVLVSGSSATTRVQGSRSAVLFDNLKHEIEIKGSQHKSTSSGVSTAPRTTANGGGSGGGGAVAANSSSGSGAQNRTSISTAVTIGSRAVPFDPLVHAMFSSTLSKLQSALGGARGETDNCGDGDRDKKKRKSEKSEKKSKKEKKNKKDKNEKKSKKSSSSSKPKKKHKEEKEAVKEGVKGKTQASSDSSSDGSDSDSS